PRGRPWSSFGLCEPAATRETATLHARPRRCQTGRDAAHDVEEDFGAERLLEHGDVDALEERPRRGVGGVTGDEDEARGERGILVDGVAVELFSVPAGPSGVGDVLIVPMPALRTAHS